MYLDTMDPCMYPDMVGLCMCPDMAAGCIYHIKNVKNCYIENFALAPPPPFFEKLYRSATANHYKMADYVYTPKFCVRIHAYALIIHSKKCQSTCRGVGRNFSRGGRFKCYLSKRCFLH